jgi:uncharacterized DUF497 family protein
MSLNVFYQVGELEFEWDLAKSTVNHIKHRVSFQEGASVFLDAEARLLDDPDYFDDETRLVLLGYSVSSRLLATVHVMRGTRVRIVSVRSATRTERSHYES